MLNIWYAQNAVPSIYPLLIIQYPIFTTSHVKSMPLCESEPSMKTDGPWAHAYGPDCKKTEIYVSTELKCFVPSTLLV